MNYAPNQQRQNQGEQEQRRPQNNHDDRRKDNSKFDKQRDQRNGGGAAKNLEAKLKDADERAKKLAQEDPCFLCMRAKRDPYHLLSQCEHFLKLSPKEKEDELRSDGRCFSCLRKGHTPKDQNCRGRPCKWCGSKTHNSRLHGARPGDSPINTRSMFYLQAMLDEDLLVLEETSEPEEEAPVVNFARLRSVMASHSVDDDKVQAVVDELTEKRSRR